MGALVAGLVAGALTAYLAAMYAGFGLEIPWIAALLGLVVAAGGYRVSVCWERLYVEELERDA